MIRSRLITTIAAGTLGIALLGACSAEGLTERAAEFGFEQAVEGNEDFDFDFSENGGGLSIQTEEGDFSLNFDEENGGIFFDTPDGQGSINFDEDGIVFDTPDGQGTVDFDENGIDFNTTEGNGSIDFSEDGVVFDNDSGDRSVFGATTAPPQWPAGLGQPATLVPGTANYSVLDFGDSLAVTGIFEHDGAENYADAVAQYLQSQGWTVRFESAQGAERYFDLEHTDGGYAQIAGHATGTSVTLTLADG